MGNSFTAGGNALVVGGTGPTGGPLVEMLLAEGLEVTLFHSGAHEVPFSRPVEHIHGDPRDRDSISASLDGRRWHVAICTSGRLLYLAEALRGKVDRLVGITGSPVYAGTMRPLPEGRLRLPVSEDAERQSTQPGYSSRIASGEDSLLDAHARGEFEAVIVRYPGIYGPRAPLNNEWVIVRHCLDKREYILVADGGVTYFHRAFASNAARLVFLCASHPNAAGEAFNAGDEKVMSTAEIVEVISHELQSPLAIESVPAVACRGLFPMADRSSQILDMSKARDMLGYRDELDVEAATRQTACWLAGQVIDADDNRAGGPPQIDYAREDTIRQWWTSAVAGLPA